MHFGPSRIRGRVTECKERDSAESDRGLKAIDSHNKIDAVDLISILLDFNAIISRIKCVYL